MLLTNCTNCGAPLKFKEEDYGKLAECSYFDTAYICDDGRMANVINHRIKVELIEL